jgi:hypothetical protein
MTAQRSKTHAGVSIGEHDAHLHGTATTRLFVGITPFDDRMTPDPSAFDSPTWPLEVAPT